MYKRRSSRKYKKSVSTSKNFRKTRRMNDSRQKKNFRALKKSFISTVPQNCFSGYATSDWYWSNYTKAINYWKSQRIFDNWEGLQNDHPEVESIIKKYLPQTYALVCNSKRLNHRESRDKLTEYITSNLNIKTEKYEMVDCIEAEVDKNLESENDFKSAESEEIELEMSEEMIEFFKESFKHKMNLKKEEDERKQKMELENQILELQSNRLKRSSEMKLLYGEDASKIIGMETAVQLSFDKYCDTKNPKYWPNIPLRL